MFFDRAYFKVFTKLAFILPLCNKLLQVDKSSPPNTNGQAGLNGVATLPSRGVSAVLNLAGGTES